MNAGQVIHLLAAGAAVDGNPVKIDLTQFLQFGILGLIFLCVILRKYLVPEWTLKQQQEQGEKELKLKDEQIVALQQDKKDLSESLGQLQALTRDQIIPALVRANQLSADYVTQLAQRGRVDPNP